MKKFLFIFIFGFVFLNFLGFTNAEYPVSEKVKTRIDGIMSIVEKQRGEKSIYRQMDRYQNIVNSFSFLKNNLDGEQKEMIGYLVYLFENKLIKLKEISINQSDILKNVDRDRVQEEILRWHNEERNKLGLSDYIINDKLNYSALVWADNLAKNNRKSSTHTRTPGDGYYNYDKILSWFNNLGIDFDYKRTAFTENVAYQVYSCNKSDCTQDMINALKKGFDFWMSEKGRSYRPHYNAISSNIFTDMGFGVGISGKWYWIVTHYGINVK